MKYPAAAEQLIKMIEVDQDMRNKMLVGPHDSKLWDKVDSENTRQLKLIIGIIGWPTFSKVGVEASEAAQLLARHADHDVMFQKKVLDLMIAEPSNEVTEISIAYLYDRICVNENRPQFFGTQFTDNTYGDYGPQEIELFEFVDERRKAIGLEMLYEYQQTLKKKYSLQ